MGKQNTHCKKKEKTSGKGQLQCAVSIAYSLYMLPATHEFILPPYSSVSANHSHEYNHIPSTQHRQNKELV